MKKGKIAKTALAVLSMMTIGTAGAALAGCDSCNSHVHNYGDWYIVTEPTLTENGTAERECPDDGNKDTQSLPKLTDTSVWTEDTDASSAPTHTTDGSKTYTSEYGSVTITIPKDENAHNYGAWDFADGKTPTMTEGGQIQRVCGGDNSHTETKDVPALSDETFWTRSVTKEPTHQSAGVASYTNATYGVTVSGIEVPKQSHTFGAWKMTVEPTLTAPGKAERVCTASGCAEDETATENKELPALSDTSFWTKGEHVDADYNHPESDTYTNEEFNLSVKVIGAPKLPVIYDGKIYHSVHVTPNIHGSISVETGWNSASLSVNNESVGFGDAYPFRGKYVLELLDPEAGLVKVSQYDKITSGSGSGGWDGEYEEGEIYSARADVEYSDTASNVFYAYVDMTTGIIIWQFNNSWNSVQVAIPTESVLSGKEFSASGCKGDLAISYNNGGTAFNILVMGEDGVAFGVSITDINGKTLTAANCFDTKVNDTGTVLVKDKDGKVIKAYALNSDNEWVVADGLQGTYKNGNDAIVVDGASSVKIDGASHRYEIVSDSADSKIIGVIIDSVYYEYTLTGDGMSADGGAYTVEAPKVTITYDFKGVTPAEDITAVNEVSKKVPLTLAVPENEEMQFIGWYTDSACTVKVSLTDGKFIPTETLTLYAKWSAKVVITIEDEIGGEKTVYAGEGELFGDIIKLYTKNQVDEASGKYFVGWYTKIGDNLISDTDEIDGNITIYAKWENVHELYGTYGGKQLLSGGARDAEIHVSALGEITGTLNTTTDSVAIDGTILSYDATTQVVKWSPKSDPTKTYLMWFDADSSMLIIPDPINEGEMYTRPFVVVRDGSFDKFGPNEQFYYYPDKITLQGKTHLFEYNNKLVLLCGDKIYSDVNIFNAFGESLNIDSVSASSTLVVKKGEDVIIAIGAAKDSFGSNTETSLDLDAYYGVYTVNVDGNDVEFRLDGRGNVTWDNGKEGIYSFINTEDNGKTNVFGIYERTKKTDTDMSDDGETTTTVTYTNVAYHELRLGVTNSIVKPMVTVTFNSNGEVNTEDVNIKIEFKLPVLTDETGAKIFRGWFTNASFDGEPVESITPENTDAIELHAKWLNKVTVKVHFNIDGEGFEEFTYGEGETATITVPERRGYRFLGWYTDAAFTDGNEWEADSVLNADIEIYAKWENVTYTLTAHYNDGTTEDKTRTYIIDERIDLDHFTPANVYVNGKLFMGWFKDEALTEAADFKSIEKNTDIYAKWEDHEPYSLIFGTDANGNFTYTFEWNENGYYVTNNQGQRSSYAGMTVKAYKDGIINLQYQVSSEANSDKLIINVNKGPTDTEALVNAHGLNGLSSGDGPADSGWVDLTVEIEANQVLYIYYYKDGSVDKGADTAWIRNLSFAAFDNSVKGTYTCEGKDDLILDGKYTVTCGTLSGTYEAMEAENTYDVFFKENGVKVSHHTLVIDKETHTYELTDVTVTINYDLTGHGENYSANVFTNVEIVLPVLSADGGLLVEGWYISDNTQLLTKITPTDSMDNITLKAKWVSPAAMAGTYKGFNLCATPSGTKEIAPESSYVSTISVTGEYSGKQLTAGKLSDEDFSKTVGSINIGKYAYVDKSIGVIWYAYYGGDQYLDNVGTDTVLLFNPDIVKSIDYSGIVISGSYVFWGTLTFTDASRENINIFGYNNVIYTDVKFSAGVTAKTANKADNTVYSADGSVIVKFKGGVAVGSDGTQGSYTGDLGTVESNGFGDLKIGDKTVEYTVVDGNIHFIVDNAMHIISLGDGIYTQVLDGYQGEYAMPDETTKITLNGYGEVSDSPVYSTYVINKKYITLYSPTGDAEEYSIDVDNKQISVKVEAFILESKGPSEYSRQFFTYNEANNSWDTDKSDSGTSYLKITINVSGTLTFNWKATEAGAAWSAFSKLKYQTYNEDGSKVDSSAKSLPGTVETSKTDIGSCKENSASLTVTAGTIIYISYERDYDNCGANACARIYNLELAS